VAESPRALLLLSKLDEDGLATLELLEPSQKAEAPIRMLSVQISSPKTSLNHGDISSVTVKVDGLTGVLPSLLPIIILENLTPKIISLEAR